MSTNVFRGTCPAIAQVWAGEVTTHIAGDTYTLTLTDLDNGDTDALTYTVTSADTTVTLVAASIVAAILASGKPLFQRLTPSSGAVAGQVVLTAAVAGQPFSVVATEGGGGSAAWQNDANVVASSSPNDYGLADNWTAGHIPTTAEDVVIPAEAPAILFGLNQTSPAIGSFTRRQGHALNIGRYQGPTGGTVGKLYPLRLHVGTGNVEIGGSGGVVAIDCGADASIVMVDSSAVAPGDGLNAVYLRGTALDSPYVVNGNVGIGTWPGDAVTLKSGGTLLVLGGDVTIGTSTVVTGVSLIHGAGSVHDYAGIATRRVGASADYQREQAVL
jgi:hypothetical protein